VKITRIYNNNVVAALDHGQEVILVGRGLGFGQQRGGLVDECCVEKRFHLAQTATGAGARGILVDLPYEVITLTAQVTRHLERQHGIVLPAPVEIGLADHLAAAFARLDEGIALPNALLWETKASYRQEFAIALEILELIRRESGRRLPLDEAGFIAMHLVNAGLTGDMADTLLLMRALHEVLDIVHHELGVPVANDSPHYVRFLTHLKFVLQRLVDGTQLHGEYQAMFEAQRAADPSAFAATQRISAHLAARFEVEVSKEEQLYLMLHLGRLRAAEGASPA
jgi:beta-glucoside operon transcriptional antiterminator